LVVASGAWGIRTRAKVEQRGFCFTGKTKEGEAAASDTIGDVE
jgi:hypothetical protein